MTRQPGAERGTSGSSCDGVSWRDLSRPCSALGSNPRRGSVRMTVTTGGGSSSSRPRRKHEHRRGAARTVDPHGRPLGTGLELPGRGTDHPDSGRSASAARNRTPHSTWPTIALGRGARRPRPRRRSAARPRRRGGDRRTSDQTEMLSVYAALAVPEVWHSLAESFASSSSMANARYQTPCAASPAIAVLALGEIPHLAGDGPTSEGEAAMLAAVPRLGRATSWPRAGRRAKGPEMRVAVA